MLILYPGLFIYNKHSTTGKLQSPQFLPTSEKFSKDDAFIGLSAHTLIQPPPTFYLVVPCMYKDTYHHFCPFPLLLATPCHNHALLCHALVRQSKFLLDPPFCSRPKYLKNLREYLLTEENISRRGSRAGL